MCHPPLAHRSSRADTQVRPYCHCEERSDVAIRSPTRKHSRPAGRLFLRFSKAIPAEEFREKYMK